MKAHKTLSRLAALFMAVMLLAALAIVPAGAVSVGSSGVATTTDGDQSVTISQTITVSDPNASVPPATFTYTLRGSDNTSGENAALPLHTGITAGVMPSEFTVVFGDDDEIVTSDGVYTVTDTFDIDFSGVAWTGVGVYRYTLTYTCDNAAVVCPDNKTLYLDVYVVNSDDDGYEVEYFVLSKNDTLSYENGSYTYTGKTGGFDGATYTTYSITVKKYISGTMANLSDTFGFSVDFTNLPQGVTVYVDDTNKANVNGSSVTATLGNEESFTISGIPAVNKSGEKVTYAVEETNAGSGYTTEYEVNTEVSKWNDEGATGTKVTSLTVGTDTVVEFENTRNAVSPTGIITTFAPYALMVVVAAGACFFFLRRRNAVED